MPGFRWSPTIGDPTFVGWFTVFAYFFAAWLCLRAFMVEKAGPPRPYIASALALLRVLRKHWPHPPVPARRAAVWLLLAALLGALGVNKQLDLQTLFTDIARITAHAQGWYEHRRPVQLLFLVVISVLACAIAWSLFRLAHGRFQDFRLVSLGVVFLSLFVVSRAASFHHVDHLLKSEILGLRVNGLLELGGIATIAIGAYARLRAGRAKTPRR